MTQSVLNLQYGINLHADHIYDSYEPIKVTSAYPDPASTALREALARYTNTSPNMIICGNGSDELLDIFVRMHALKDKKQTLVIAPPTFFEYPKYALRVGAKLIEMPHDRTLITPEELQKRGAEPKHTIVLIDSPSNPAGDIAPSGQILALLEVGYTVIADEAYYEFYGKSVIDLLQRFPKTLVVSRTFSKFCAMSGSRLGYMIGDPAMIGRMNELKPFFNINSDTQARALYALQHIDEFTDVLNKMKQIYHSTKASIEALKTYQLFSSLEMYIIFKHLTVPSPELQKKLRDDHFIETFLFNDFKDHSVIRATVGKGSDMERLVTALGQVA